jgi:hypothetical protein
VQTRTENVDVELVVEADDDMGGLEFEDEPPGKGKEIRFDGDGDGIAWPEVAGEDWGRAVAL